MTDIGATPERLLGLARAGDADALGRLLDLYRNYLRLLARSLVGRSLGVQIAPSDLVQETFLKAYRDFPRFAGGGEPELAAWLRRILVRTLADQVKHHRRLGRDVRRQASLEDLLDRSCSELRGALGARGPSPSEGASRREQAVLLADALRRLPADRREVFTLRTLEHVPLEEIAGRMGRSAGAVRMLWARAVEDLGRILEAEA